MQKKHMDVLEQGTKMLSFYDEVIQAVKNIYKKKGQVECIKANDSVLKKQYGYSFIGGGKKK